MSQQVLIVDDDEAFSHALNRALTKRSFDVLVANKIADLKALPTIGVIPYAIVDLRIANESGLDVIEYLLEENSEMRIVMLTAYASIATAVEAIKLGAKDYLMKPVLVDDIIEKLTLNHIEQEISIEETTLSVKRLEWEHLQKVLLEHDGNISAAARALNMHRRTLQRKLQKYPVKR